MCQPGRPRPHGEGQYASAGSSGFDALPEGEVARVALAALRGVAGRLHGVGVLAGERAVLRVGGDVEVDVTGAVARPTYACPAAISSAISSCISGMCPVARGS